MQTLKSHWYMIRKLFMLKATKLRMPRSIYQVASRTQLITKQVVPIIIEAKTLNSLKRLLLKVLLLCVDLNR